MIEAEFYPYYNTDREDNQHCVYIKAEVYIMRRIYIVTGAAGHLGSTIIRMLLRQGECVRGLILPTEQVKSRKNVQYFCGDIRDIRSLRPLFKNTQGAEVFVIHTAGVIDISEQVSPQMYEVNGTKNILALCSEYHVKRLLYVSSVHAIPEKEGLKVLSEVHHFSPEQVVGGYAKTKAEATQAVLDAVEEGLDAVIVHPSGILGPYDNTGNHLVQMVKEYINGKLPACVRGGYDFVDVRDVAFGCLQAVKKGRKGECYILSNRHYEIKDVLNIAKKFCHGKKIPVLPMWMARSFAPIMSMISKHRHERPLYTKYSLYTLRSNDRFSHDKATHDLGYRPRDLYQTIRDTVFWLKGKRVPV